MAKLLKEAASERRKTHDKDKHGSMQDAGGNEREQDTAATARTISSGIQRLH